ncbi:MAG: MCE family protein [Sciscionella sp.]
MFGGRTKIQIALFLAIAVAGIVFAGGKYAGLGRLFGIDGYYVTVHLADSGGIFSNAEVTYRGIPVGRVSALRLTGSGVDVRLNIDSGAPPIPASARAVVADRSAIGEQYVDLEPPNGDGPYLADGAVIPQDHSTLPPTPASLLKNLDNLARSVPTGSLRTVVNELDTAFSGTGPDLQKLLDAASSLTDSASQHLPQTTGLLASGRTVLDTQRDQAANLTRLSRGLNLIAGQLKSSDPDIRKVITQAPLAADEVDQLLRTSGNDLSLVLANLLTVTDVVRPRQASLKELLVGLPVIGGFSPGLSRGHSAHLAFVMDFADPYPCTRGYQGTQQHAGTDTTAGPANTKAYCAEPPGSPIEVRGAQNAPYAGKPESMPVTPGSQQTQQQRPQAPVSLPGALGLLGSGNGAVVNLGQLLGLPE